MTSSCSRAYLAFALVLVLTACNSGSSSNAADAGDVTPADCSARCSSKAQSCGAPPTQAAQECASLCPRVTSAAQLSCLESSSCSDLMTLLEGTGTVCGIGDDDGGQTGGAFGDACKCSPDGTGFGEFQCAGTEICQAGLLCVGTRIQGVDNGSCRGPECCSGTDDCAAKLGQQASCAAGQTCACERGDLECVGTSCTCEGGVAATSGLCYPE